MREIFDEMDANKNGELDYREFDEFVRRLVGKQSPQMSKPMFTEIDEDSDGRVTFDEFNTYFNRLLLDQTMDSELEVALRSEFLRADSTGTGAVDFKVCMLL